MSNLLCLCRRNSKIFIRTKGNIIFSSLALIILVVLHIAVFRKMNTDIWVQITDQFPGFEIQRDQLSWLTDSLMFAAILPIGAVSISLVALGLMIADKEKNVLSDFLVSPLRRATLLGSYLLSSFVIGLLVLCAFVLFFGVYFVVMYDVWFTPTQVALIVSNTVFSLIFSNAFMLLLLSFFKTQQSLSAVGTIVGTLIGFLSGAYIPVGQFGPLVCNVFSVLPFLQLTVLSKQAFLKELFVVTPLTQEMITGKLARDFGIELWLGDTQLTNGGIVSFTGAVTVVLLVILLFRFTSMKKED